MILLHQVHSLRPGAAAEFEEVTRDQLLPLVASETARFAFYAVPTGAAIHQDEAITMIALEDGQALGGFSHTRA